MNTTPVSLLERLRQPHQEEAWSRFVQLYTPLLYHWAKRIGLAEADAADLVQDVFTVLVQKLPGFTYQHGKSFRGWLWTVMPNLWRAHWRRQSPVNLGGTGGVPEVAVPDELEELREEEHRRYLIGRALKLMRTDFHPTTWAAFWECTTNGRPAAEVAAELGLSTNAVYTAKSRVLRRLRQELEGLM